jgi:hypothetical protein
MPLDVSQVISGTVCVPPLPFSAGDTPSPSSLRILSSSALFPSCSLLLSPCRYEFNFAALNRQTPCQDRIERDIDTAGTSLYGRPLSVERLERDPWIRTRSRPPPSSAGGSLGTYICVSGWEDIRGSVALLTSMLKVLGVLSPTFGGDIASPRTRRVGLSSVERTEEWMISSKKERRRV